jgi:hypothetical protein
MAVRAFACYADDRNKGFCVHCGGPDESRDHVPSKVLLDEPLPPNVMVSPSCAPCNQGFSLDEEYLACLIECIVAGDVEPDKIERPKIAYILRSNPRLVKTLRKAKLIGTDGQIRWHPNYDRVKKILMKLARGHVAHELNEPRLDDPTVFVCKSLATMTFQERHDFETQPSGDISDAPFWPQVGSRAMQRLLIVDNVIYEEDWLTVQEGRYRFRVFDSDGGIGVRMVIREYLACEIVWD